MITRRRLLGMAGGVGALAMSRARTGRAADLDEVKIVSPLVISDAPFFIGEHKGYWKDQGLKVTLINMQTGPHMIAPLGTGQIDIAAAATSAGLYNAEARGIGLKIVADKGSNLPGYAYVSLLIRKELVDSGKFNTLKDLKGLKIAEPGKGGSTGATVAQAAKSAGLKYDDLNHVFLGFPEMLTGLQSGAIDGAIVPEPFLTFGIEKGIGVKFPSDAFYPRQTISIVLYGNQFMAKRGEVAHRFMLAYLKSARFYNGAIKDGHFAGPNAAELIDMLVKDTRYKDPALYQKVVPNGCDPDGHVYKPSLETDLAFWQEQKFIEGKASVDEVLDHSYVDAALKTLGPYKAS
jgi:NitT/TauT family transport system substrate-binding protein